MSAVVVFVPPMTNQRPSFCLLAILTLTTTELQAEMRTSCSDQNSRTAEKVTRRSTARFVLAVLNVTEFFKARSLGRCPKKVIASTCEDVDFMIYGYKRTNLDITGLLGNVCSSSSDQASAEERSFPTNPFIFLTC